MKIEFSKRATADLHKMSADSRERFGDRIVAELEAGIHQVVEQISHAPASAPRVVERQGVHVVPLVRYPYKLFYRVLSDRVRILHVRHTSRRPW